MDTDIKRSGEEEITNLVDVLPTSNVRGRKRLQILWTSYRHQTSGGGRDYKSCGRLTDIKRPGEEEITNLVDVLPTSNVRGRKILQILWTSYRHQTSGGGRDYKSCGRLTDIKRPGEEEITNLVDVLPTSNVRGRKRLQILWTSYRHQTSGGGRDYKSCGHLTDIKRPGEEEITNLVDVLHGCCKRPGRKRIQILWTSYMDVANTLKGWNELLDYLQTNNAFRKSKFINYNFDDSTSLAPLSRIQDVLDYLNEFIALQSVRHEYYKELSKPILLP